MSKSFLEKAKENKFDEKFPEKPKPVGNAKFFVFHKSDEDENENEKVPESPKEKSQKDFVETKKAETKRTRMRQHKDEKHTQRKAEADSTENNTIYPCVEGQDACEQIEDCCPDKCAGVAGEAEDPVGVSPAGLVGVAKKTRSKDIEKTSTDKTIAPEVEDGTACVCAITLDAEASDLIEEQMRKEAREPEREDDDDDDDDDDDEEDEDGAADALGPDNDSMEEPGRHPPPVWWG